MGNIVIAIVTSNQIHLVFHEGNQWTYNNSNAGKDHCRKLVTKAFTTAGGHDNKSISAREQGFDCCELLSFKILETEMFVKC